MSSADAARPLRVTGGVSRVGLHPALTADAVRLDQISYLAGAHTQWHVHTGEQILYGQQGRGWLKFDGSARLTIESGSVAYVPVGVRHWHGATPDAALVHLAFTASGDTIWLDEVTLEEYLHG
jgi:quercetin dioxygenase-like cupin family protein